MNVSLRPDLENLVNEKIKSGQYRSAEEVLNAALQLLKQTLRQRIDQRAC